MFSQQLGLAAKRSGGLKGKKEKSHLLLSRRVALRVLIELERFSFG